MQCSLSRFRQLWETLIIANKSRWHGNDVGRSVVYDVFVAGGQSGHDETERNQGEQISFHVRHQPGGYLSMVSTSDLELQFYVPMAKTCRFLEDSCEPGRVRTLPCN